MGVEGTCQEVSWWSDAARPWPNESIALLCCFTEFLCECEHECLLVCRDLVFCDMACDALAVVIAVAFDVPPCTHFDLAFPCWAIVRELLAKTSPSMFCPLLPQGAHLVLSFLLGFRFRSRSFASSCLCHSLLLCSARLLAWVQRRERCKESSWSSWRMQEGSFGRICWGPDLVCCQSWVCCCYLCARDAGLLAHSKSPLNSPIDCKEEFFSGEFVLLSGPKHSFLFVLRGVGGILLCPCTRSLPWKRWMVPPQRVGVGFRGRQSLKVCILPASAMLWFCWVTSSDLVLGLNDKWGSLFADSMSLVLARERQRWWSCLMFSSRHREIFLGRGLWLSPMQMWRWGSLLFWVGGWACIEPGQRSWSWWNAGMLRRFPLSCCYFEWWQRIRACSWLLGAGHWSCLSSSLCAQPAFQFLCTQEYLIP